MFFKKVRENNDMGGYPQRRSVRIGKYELPLPGSRKGRIVAGSALVAGGTLGFLPVLGFWMLPLGVLVLSHEFHVVRRSRRRFVVWWSRRRARGKAARSAGDDK